MRMTITLIVLGLLAGSAIAAEQPVPSAKSRVLPTDGNTVKGTVTFARVGDGVFIRAHITGLPPDSRHAFHIHEEPDCSAPDASSAGPHWNPLGHPHGDPTAGKHHLGDMPNLQSDAAGEARLEYTLKGATLATGRKTDLLLHSVIVHAAEDDYTTQPTGNAGARLACGVIQ